MRSSLLWKLIAINLVVLGIAMLVAAIAIGRLANMIFGDLMHEFNLQVDAMKSMFNEALRRSLLFTSLVAGLVGLSASVVLFRGVVRPLRTMMAMAGRIAAGDYGARASVRTADEVGSLASSLNTMAASLERLEKLRKDLVANVAHELRTPLSNLRGYLEAIREGVTPPSPETIGLLHEEVMRLVRLVQALHELSTFDANVPRRRTEDVDLGTLIRRTLDLRRGEFAEQRVAVHSDVAVPGPVRADPDLLAQALHNLLDNAVNYTPRGGHVTVQATQEGQSIRLAVTNTGQGIDAGDLPYIFERFYRGDKSRSRDSGGAGIGLAIVKEVARAHGGSAGATSGGGTTTVWLTLDTRHHSVPAPAR